MAAFIYFPRLNRDFTSFNILYRPGLILQTSFRIFCTALFELLQCCEVNLLSESEK